MPDEELPAVPGNEVLLQQDQHRYEIAKLNIEKTCENNAMWAEHWYKMRLAAYVFAGVGLLLVFTFCAIALFIGKDAIAMEIIKAGIFIVAGGGAGYAIGYRRGQNSGTE